MFKNANVEVFQFMLGVLIKRLQVCGGIDKPNEKISPQIIACSTGKAST